MGETYANMVNFGPRESVPERFAERQFNIHNAAVTLMRTTPDECAAIGKEMAQKVSASNGPAAIYLPHNGVSAIDKHGQPFDAPKARAALFDAIRQNHGGWNSSSYRTTSTTPLSQLQSLLGTPKT